MKLFDWLRRGRRQDEPPEEWWQRLSRLENDMQQLELGWEETYGKVRRALATLAKRQQREADAGEQPEPAAGDGARGVAAPDASDYAKLRAMYGRR